MLRKSGIYAVFNHILHRGYQKSFLLTILGEPNVYKIAIVLGCNVLAGKIPVYLKCSCLVDFTENLFLVTGESK